jgi:hypothetical protein
MKGLPSKGRRGARNQDTQIAVFVTTQSIISRDAYWSLEEVRETGAP